MTEDIAGLLAELQEQACRWRNRVMICRWLWPVSSCVRRWYTLIQVFGRLAWELPLLDAEPC